MKKSTKLRDPIFRTINKTLYLKQILDRMEDEYLQILNFVQTYNLEDS